MNHIKTKFSYKCPHNIDPNLHFNSSSMHRYIPQISNQSNANHWIGYVKNMAKLL